MDEFSIAQCSMHTYFLNSILDTLEALTGTPSLYQVIAGCGFPRLLQTSFSRLPTSTRVSFRPDTFTGASENKSIFYIEILSGVKILGQVEVEAFQVDNDHNNKCSSVDYNQLETTSLIYPEYDRDNPSVQYGEYHRRVQKHKRYLTSACLQLRNSHVPNSLESSGAKTGRISPARQD